jgi:hypothetical protein
LAFSREAGFVFSKEQIECHAQHLIHLNPAYYAMRSSQSRILRNCNHMKPLPLRLDEPTFRALNRIAPAATRQRAEFVRSTIRKAIRKTEEERTWHVNIEQRGGAPRSSARSATALLGINWPTPRNPNPQPQRANASPRQSRERSEHPPNRQP